MRKMSGKHNTNVTKALAEKVVKLQLWVKGKAGAGLKHTPQSK